MNNDLNSIREKLRPSPNDWQWRVANLIARIPPGRIITYGDLSKWANSLFTMNISARNVAWLRARLYKLLTHSTKVPLHHVAKKGDLSSKHDSVQTRKVNNKLRAKEGSLSGSPWWKPEVYLLELSTTELIIARMVNNSAPPGRHSARSALKKLEESFLIKDICPEMAAFWAITAEEESTTAVFHALKRWKYSGSLRLRTRHHIDKNALTPFLWGVERALALADELKMKPTLVFENTHGDTVIKIRLTVPLPNGQNAYAFPDPPLNFNLHKNGVLADFDEELKAITDSKGIKSISDQLKQRAQQRNDVLYAVDTASPKESVGDSRAIRYRCIPAEGRPLR